MSDLGATAGLLEAARTVLRERIMPSLDADGRYEAAMVANAIAIAIRDLQLGPAARAQEGALLASFYDSPDATLGELRSRLCRDLRAGDFELARATELRALLEQVADDRLAISNPSYGQSQR